MDGFSDVNNSVASTDADPSTPKASLFSLGHVSSRIAKIFQTISDRLSPAKRRRRWQSRIFLAANGRMSLFEALKSVSSADKARIRVAVRHHLNRLAAADLWKGSIENALNYSSVGIGFAGTMVFPLFIVQRWIGTPHSVGTWALICLGYVYAWLFALIVVGGPLLLLPKVGNHSYLRFLYLPGTIWAGIVILVYSFFIYRIQLNPRIVSHHWTVYIAVSAMLGVLIYGLVIIIAIMLTAPVSYALTQRKKRLYADAVLVSGLLILLAYVEEHEKQWNQMNFKKWVISELENLALGIEVYLFQSFRPHDSLTENWIKERSHEMAATVRKFKSWILTPMPDTPLQFKCRLGCALVHAASGAWDSLERTQITSISEPRRWHTRVLNWLGVILTGGIPLLLFELIQRMPTLKLPDPVAQYLHVGVLMWAALALIAAFDPLFGAKVTALKDVFQLLPIPGKKKD
jgi:hypothetical protein